MEGFEWVYATVGAGVGAALTGGSVWIWQRHFACPAPRKGALKLEGSGTCQSERLINKLRETFADGIDMASGESRTEGLSICEKGKLQYFQKGEENQPPHLGETHKSGKIPAILAVITNSGKSDSGLKIKAIRDCATPRGMSDLSGGGLLARSPTLVYS
jgi:hypothetical protein